MKENVDFRKVANTVRYGLLGSMYTPTPENFGELSDEEKKQIYEQLFDLLHDVCNYLSSSMYIDELNTKYEKINAQKDSRNDAADE